MNAPEPAFIAAASSSHLHRMLTSAQLDYMMEVGNGLTARIVREAGFKAVWTSGLAVSAQFGLCDNNEINGTQVVDDLEFMADASDLPTLLDGDTGYGNLNNVRRLVQKLEQRGIASVCIENKQLLKTSSFIKGERQPPAEVNEFCGKFKACKDSQPDEHFSIVTRVEALIAGWGMDEALRRAETYRQAGAEKIQVHSKLSCPDEVLEFARQWAGRGPLVILPIKYYSTPAELFRETGISTVIWANHLIRASTSVMQEVAKQLQASKTLINTGNPIAQCEYSRAFDADQEANDLAFCGK